MEDTEQTFANALAMPPLKKAMLIEQLFQSLDRKNQKSIDQAWATEAESRIRAYDAGLISARPFDEVLKDLDNR